MLMTMRGVSQIELSKKTGISVTSLSRYLNEKSNLRAEYLLKVLSALGADLDVLVKKEINKNMGHEDEASIGDDIRYLMENAAPITRKTVAGNLIATFKNEKHPDMRARIQRLRKYKDSIKTVRRMPC
jgi:transcriptional regulator with XRE-family HTH domain